MQAWRMYGLGTITKPQFVQLASALILQANGRAAALADLSLSVELTRLSGTAYAPTGTLPKVYQQATLAKGMETLLSAAEAGEDITERLSRFALNAPLDAAVGTYSDAIAGTTTVEGWVRQMDSDPCQLCRYWWREGQVWARDHRMPHHKGCACVQRPVLTERRKRA
ncbi:MAG: hypothetical protein ACOH19_15000 [Rhodoglobus sp.]